VADGGLVAIRFALYADLMLLVGLAAFPLYSFTRAERESRAVLRIDSLLMWLGVAGLLFSVAGFAIASAAMMGVPFTDINGPMLVSMASETDMGTAWCVRLVALSATVIGLLFIRRNQGLQLAWALTGGTVALATLLWSGHAAATEGGVGTAHRVSDITHMIAASIWVGGIAAFGLMLRPHREARNDSDVEILARALATFSRVGTAAVSVIVITGLFNGFVILGGDISALVKSTYGWLLTTKIALVSVMLILAVNNRWRLTPALERSGESDTIESTLARLRVSVTLEAAAGATVLALVAWLGTLAPTASL
jgi:putative copper resistance protein D